MKEEGYEVEHDGYCITVFSAPNYCDQMCGPSLRCRHPSRSSDASFLGRHLWHACVMNT